MGVNSARRFSLLLLFPLQPLVPTEVTQHSVDSHQTWRSYIAGCDRVLPPARLAGRVYYMALLKCQIALTVLRKPLERDYLGHTTGDLWDHVSVMALFANTCCNPCGGRRHTTSGTAFLPRRDLLSLTQGSPTFSSTLSALVDRRSATQLRILTRPLALQLH